MTDHALSAEWSVFKVKGGERGERETEARVRPKAKTALAEFNCSCSCPETGESETAERIPKRFQGYNHLVHSI